jgi:hypothetical protein
VTTSGRFCPVSRAIELPDERRTMPGSRHVDELRQAVPRRLGQRSFAAVARPAAAAS